MKTLLSVLALSFAMAAPAHAISRYNSERLSCDRIHRIIDREGAAILRYQSRRNPSLTLYDRYVRHGGFCMAGEYAKYATVPAADTPACPVYRCFQQTFYPND